MAEGQPRFLDRFSKGTKVGFVVLGYVLGIIGVLIDWAIGHRKKMMECSAEAIWYGLIGWGANVITRFILIATGVYAHFGLTDPVQGAFWSWGDSLEYPMVHLRCVFHPSFHVVDLWVAY